MGERTESWVEGSADGNKEEQMCEQEEEWMKAFKEKDGWMDRLMDGEMGC